jgi:hypothetical protein
MTATYEQNAAAARTAEAAVGTELKAKQQEVAERVKATEEAFAKIGRALSQPKQPARRPEDNDLSAKAEAYQEADDDPPPAPLPAPVVRRPDEDEEVASFRWDEDPPAKPERPREQPSVQQAKPQPRDDEDLSDREWLE